jgi:methionyl-tRNA formyltransferase
MRVVFMGTPDFAVPSLEALADTHALLAVYTQPDRPRGRGRAPVPSAVKSAALRLGIPVRQPASLAEESVLEDLRADAPDVICVAAYGVILPPTVLQIPAQGCLNVHASLLPEYRGAAPIHRAVLDGQIHTGVTVMRMEAGLDTGPYSLVYRTPIEAKTVTELEQELAREGARLLVEALEDLADGSIIWHAQDDARATYASKIAAHDVALSPDLDVETALRRIRASTRSARAKISLAGYTLDVTAATRTEDRLPQGAARSVKDALFLGFSDGAIVAEEVRPEGRACMAGCAWARGARMSDECQWGPA